MLKRPMPVKAPLRFRPRGVLGEAADGRISVSIASAVVAVVAGETESRDSCDCVSAVGVSGISSSSEMGEGMRLLRSWLAPCLHPFHTGGGCCMHGTGMLLTSMPPAEPLVG